MYSLESPYRGDSYEYTQHTFSRLSKRSLNIPNILMFTVMKKKSRVEIAVVNEPPVLEPSKFQCYLE